VQRPPSCTSMGCNSSSNAAVPEADAPVTTEIPANAHPAPVQETAAAPHSAVAPVATVSEPAPNAQPSSSALLEGRMTKAKQ
jgi:hypothetical protein